MLSAIKPRNIVRFGASPLAHFVKKREASSKAISPELKKLMKYWWTEDGDYRHLHKLNDILMPEIREGLMVSDILDRRKIETAFYPKPFKNLSFLVIGCGTGIVTEPIASSGGNVIGIDTHKERIAVAKAHLSKSTENLDLVYSCATIENFAQNNLKLFDVVVLPEIIEQMDRKDHVDFVTSAINLVKPNGSLFITTINATAEAMFYCMLENYFRQSMPYGHYNFKKFIKHNVLCNILEDHKMEIMAVKGLDWCANDKKWKIVQRNDLWLLFHAVKKP